MRTTEHLRPPASPTGWQSPQYPQAELSHFDSEYVTVTPSSSPFLGSMAGVGTFSTSAATTLPPSMPGHSCSWGRTPTSL